MHDYEATRRLGAPGPSVCALVQDMLPFYLDNDLTRESRAFIDDHLHTCERCASFLAGGRSVQEHLRRDPSLRQPRPVSYPVRTDDIVARGRRRLLAYALLGAGIVAFLIIGFSTARPEASVMTEIAPPTAVPPVGDVGSEILSVPELVNPITDVATPTPWSASGAMGGAATPTPVPMIPDGQIELPPTPVPADIPPPTTP